jgi:hypothetical protein
MDAEIKLFDGQHRAAGIAGIAAPLMNRSMSR